MLKFDEPAHPWIQHRQAHKPPQRADEHVGFNGLLAAGITKGVGTMWAFYLAAAVMAGWMIFATVGLIRFDPYPFAFLLFLGNIVQLLLMFVIMVGQQVLGASADKRAIQTYKDAEAILHECLRLQRHLHQQDELLNGLTKEGAAAAAG